MKIRYKTRRRAYPQMIVDYCCKDMKEHFCEANKQYDDSKYITYSESCDDVDISIIIHGGVYGDQSCSITHCPWCGAPVELIKVEL